MSAPDSGLPIFHAPFAPPDEDLAATLLADAARDADAESRIDSRAKRLVEAIRAKAGGGPFGGGFGPSAASTISCTLIRSRPKRAWR